MIFLTSSPTGPLDNCRPVEGLDELNEFRNNIKKCWKDQSRCLAIASSPEDYVRTEEAADFFFRAIEKSGLTAQCMDILDNRNSDMSREILHSYDVIFLFGGHVPTQNAFFTRIGLKEKIKDFQGIVIGISAGSMNSAEVVYAQPEMEGEACDPEYRRFIPGLGLTRTQILPHYQMIKDYTLDGHSLFQEITCEDSFGNAFLILPDGSYLLIDEGREEVWGEAYCYSNGSFFQINKDGQRCRWPLT